MGRRKGTREGLKKRRKEIKRKRATPREGEGKEMREKEKERAIKRKIKRTRELVCVGERGSVRRV